MNTSCTIQSWLGFAYYHMQSPLYHAAQWSKLSGLWRGKYIKNVLASWMRGREILPPPFLKTEASKWIMWLLGTWKKYRVQHLATGKRNVACLQPSGKQVRTVCFLHCVPSPTLSPTYRSLSSNRIRNSKGRDYSMRPNRDYGV